MRTEQNVFVIYDNLGTPILYAFNPSGKSLTQEQMNELMDATPEADSNAETWLEWKEIE